MKSAGIIGDGYERLLACLDSDPVRAADKFEELRHKLVGMLGKRGARFPVTEDLADEALARVANNLAAGKVIDNLNAHTCIVAQNVWHEWLRRDKRHVTFNGDNSNNPPDKDDNEADHNGWIERLLQCLNECLAVLPPESRYLIVEYYRFSGEEAIKHRRWLAAKLGISPTALALRVHRLRHKLESCITRCERKK